MIVTISTSVILLSSVVLVAALLRTIYKSSSSFILRQYLSRSIDAAPALLFQPSSTHSTNATTSDVLPPYITVPTFGVTALLACRRAAKEGKLEQLWTRWLRKSQARTVEVKMLGCRLVLTDEGGNIEEVLGGGGGEWGVARDGWFGRKVLGEEFGDEIESVNIEDWVLGMM
ncbi:hypothetical protein IQ06DRAFT_311347 [Phaeosphaeriaceae sp. SRC1lsM3a]|nr:hypothetical protein IQ06DRAFT_311347 [Stagonospora sp. SRC1lsM3a]